MIDLNIKRTLTITLQDVCDILTTAIEGGVDYWVTRYAVTTPPRQELIDDHFKDAADYYTYMAPAFGGAITITDGIDGGTHVVTLENLTSALQKIADIPGWSWLFDGAEFEAGNVDANVADSIIQYAVFGEEVYG